MRNIIIPAVLFILVITFVALNLFYITDNASRLDAILVSASDAAKNGDFEEATAEVERFKEEFSAVGKYLFAVIQHNEVDDVIFSSNRLLALCNADTKEQFLSEIEVTRESIKLIRDAEIPYLENIL
ncbi:MAG: DUF4363 family protein [Clostridia bacterium]|nr:DUF4363 family protein [Clostridia bacterium]